MSQDPSFQEHYEQKAREERDGERAGGGPSRRPFKLLLAAIVALVVLLLVVLPPLLKLNRYAREISQSMSQSLGRPVHLDNVSLGLLPVPHLTLQNVVVSEDPAFGSEPTIRANTVEANLRLSSLWRRPMEFSRVRFVEPSVNLVRNADGHWNLEGVLVHAAQVNTAPTVQSHRSSAPRFPYIEATGGRVNLKLGEEKKPFSLVDANFALWLPSPEQWSVRLTGTPARTDTNLNDSGVFRVEGSLQRAAHMEQVPVTLQLSWHDAPLGEATRLLSGDDQGWRGTAQVDASLKGSLGAGRLAVDVTLDDVRRTDFVPAHSLALHLRCVGLAEVPAAALHDLACELPAGGHEPLRLQAENVDLTRPLAASATMQAEGVPLEWFGSWARLFSARFPAAPALPGSIDAMLSRDGIVPERNAQGDATQAQSAPAVLAPGVLRGWLGTIRLTLPQPQGTDTASIRRAAKATPSVGEAPGSSRSGTLTPQGPATQGITAELTPGDNADTWQLVLPATPVTISTNSTLNVSGTATPAGYSLRANGQATTATVLRVASRLPPLADGLQAVLGPVADDLPVRVDFNCSRGWSGATGDQLCVRAAEPLRKSTKARR